jgi:drug/metabolite transporter (DMT)-like permease
MVLLAGLLWSFGGTAVRLAETADAWQYMACRAFGQVALTLLWAGLVPAPSGGWLGLLKGFLRGGALVWFGAGMAALSAIAFIFALKTTLVADALLLSSSVPLWTAVLAFLLLKERIDRLTIAALALGALGMVVMVGTGLSTGNLFGNAMALLSALAFAAYAIVLRRDAQRDATPMILGYGLLALAACLAVTLAQGRSLLVPPLDFAAGFVHGFLFIGIGFLLYARGARSVPAGDATILTQTETLFGPLWVWLLFGETPPMATLGGGALVLAAVALAAFANARRVPPPLVH